MRPTRSLIALAVAVACTAVTAAPVPSLDGVGTQAIATDPLLRRAFVTNHDSGMLSIFNLDQLSLVATAPVGRAPRAIIGNVASSRLYVLNGGAPGTVTVLDTAGALVARPIAIGDEPHAMVADFLRGQLFVSNAASGTVSVIDLLTNAVVATVPAGSSPSGIGVDRLRGKLYVTDAANDAVTVIDAELRSVQGSVVVGRDPGVPVVDERSGRVFVNNVADQTVSVVDPDTLAVVATLPSGRGAATGTFSPVYRKYYATNTIDGTLTIIDADALKVVATVPVGASPHEASVDSNDGTVYVTAGDDDTVTVVGATDGHAVSSIRTVISPQRLAMDDEDRLLVVDDSVAAPSAVARKSVAPGTAIASEYYDAAFDTYFHASNASEIRLLDDGIHGRAWAPTQQFFRVWTTPGSGRVPVCRLYTAGFTPRSSHVYTPYADECDRLKAGGVWQFESIAYFVGLPDVDGACAAGTEVLYRLYNDGQGGAPNHRFTRERVIRDAMLARGWLAEGRGVDHVFACTPALRADGLAHVAASPRPGDAEAPPMRAPLPLRPRPK